MINEQSCVFAASPKDPVAFADALEKAAKHRAWLKEIGARGSLLVKKQFDRKLLTDRWVHWVTEGKL